MVQIMARRRAKQPRNADALLVRIRDSRQAFPFDLLQMKALVTLYYKGVTIREPKNRPLNKVLGQRKSTTSVIQPGFIPSTGDSLVSRISHDEMTSAMNQLTEWAEYSLKVWTARINPNAEENKDKPVPSNEDTWAACCAISHGIKRFL